MSKEDKRVVLLDDHWEPKPPGEEPLTAEQILAPIMETMENYREQQEELENTRSQVQGLQRQVGDLSNHVRILQEEAAAYERVRKRQELIICIGTVIVAVVGVYLAITAFHWLLNWIATFNDAQPITSSYPTIPYT